MWAYFSTQDAADLIGASYANLDHWLRVNIMSSTVGANGIGSRRQWSFTDIVVAALIKALGQANVPLSTRRKAVEVAREHWQSGDPRDAGRIQLEWGSKENVVWTPAKQRPLIWRSDGHEVEMAASVNLTTLAERIQARIAERNAAQEPETQPVEAAVT